MSNRIGLGITILSIILGALVLPALSQTANESQPGDKNAAAPRIATQEKPKDLERALKRLTEENAFLNDEIDRLTADHKKEVQRLTRQLEASVKPPAQTKARGQTLVIIKMLQQPIETAGLAEPVKLKVALEYFTDKFGGKLPILVNRGAFLAALGENTVDPYEEEVSLPPVPRNMVLSTALQMILSQIGEGQGTYNIRKDYIEIVPLKYSKATNFLNQPFVAAAFHQRPLREVLDELADETGISIHLDANLGNKANTPINATFRNDTLEDALTTVTEMAELKYVVLERSIYVTTADKAAAIRCDEKQRAPIREKFEPKARKLEAPA